ncbi:alcohol dehydrogenase catalytic domain-containing protein [Catelliglobosispora koreensis]|uniref:alcohol dehydrogenase catalytic domain-containing protein n=1 Tax=Catelliglobosispora koreensis TaxID=129052 RepID=UPI0003785F13|nr:zinc-binding dehydrogenase [Catelliglobosispora koreensis]
MRLIRQHAFGAPDVLRFEEVPDLSPAPGQVRIAVAAAGVHMIDTTIRSGGPGPFPRPDLPMTPGREVAGVVDALGSDVDSGWLGQRVVAHLGMASGGYAEQAVTAAEALLPIPEGITEPEAVALVGTGRTAISILDLAQLSQTDVVLVTGAAGGLGSIFVQAIKHAGAKVIAAAGGAAKLATVDADEKADYTAADWAENVTLKPTVVLDGVGGQIGRAALKLLKPTGRIVMYSKPVDLKGEDLFGITAIGALGRPFDQKVLATRALQEAAQGRWKITLTAFPLAKAAQAHEAIETRATVGKTVLIP